jgi:hypothetical protein
VSRLPDLRDRLLGLHKLLLDDEARAYQAAHGRVVSGNELFRLLLEDGQFAWLRALSGLIAEIDAALDEAGDVPAAVRDRTFLEQTRGLLRSEGEGPFETKYRDALQRSPDVVMAHAAVIKLITAR